MKSTRHLMNWISCVRKPSQSKIMNNARRIPFQISLPGRGSNCVEKIQFQLLSPPRSYSAATDDVVRLVSLLILFKSWNISRRPKPQQEWYNAARNTQKIDSPVADQSVVDTLRGRESSLIPPPWERLRGSFHQIDKRQEREGKQEARSTWTRAKREGK